MAEYVAEIERASGSEWGWRIAMVSVDGSPGDTVDEHGYAPVPRGDMLRGRTWTRWGARREARRALRRLRRYLDRPEPEVIHDA